MEQKAFLHSRLVAVLCILFAPVCEAQFGELKGRVSGSGENLTGATVLLGNYTAVTDSTGKFSFSVEPGRYLLVISHAGYERLERTLKITARSLQEYQFELQQAGNLPDVIVLGSRSMKERSKLNSPVPVDVIPISVLPARQVNLTAIVANNVPSFNAAAQGFGQGKHIIPASLRGLGPDQTLVLLNGKRLHTVASPWTLGVNGFGTVGVDLNTIPAGAVESIEVLRDGASAQYGSDAIAGVINIQLKKSIGTTSIDVHSGQYYEGDGEAFAFTINRGTAFFREGFINLTGQLKFNNYTNRSGVYDGTVYYNIPSSASPSQADSLRKLDEKRIAQSGLERENLRPVGDNKLLNIAFAMNGGYPVSKRTNFYWTTVWSYRFVKDRSSSLYRFPKDSLRLVNTQLYPNGFLPILESSHPDITITGGLNGLMKSGWHWDASTSYGHNGSRVNVKNSNNATQYADGIRAQREFFTGRQTFSQVTNNLNFSRELLKHKKAIQSLSLAFGMEHRFDHYRIQEGEEASWKNYSPTSGRVAGSQGQAGFQPENSLDKRRYVIAGYAEIEIEKNSRLLYNLATRYEYYSDFGDNLAGKFAFRYRLSKRILGRGSVSNGFRAPALQQRFYGLVTTISRPGGILLRTGTFNNDSEVARAFGISPLVAENSLNFSLGLTSPVNKSISISLDGYWIQIKNRIIYSGNIPDTFPEVRTILDNAGFRDVQTARFFSNAINTRTLGIDLIITGKWNWGKAILETSLAVNLNKTSLYGSIQYAKNLPDNEKYRNLLVNREERCRVEDAYPKDKVIVSGRYSVANWKISSSVARYGQVAQKGSDPKNFPDEFYSPKILVGINILYNVRSWMAITAGAENMFDSYPDRLKYKSNTSNGVLIYNPNFAPFGCNGGYYYLNLSLRL